MAFSFSARRLAPWLCVLPLFALGCNRQSPTEPASSPKVAAATTDGANVSAPGDSGEKARGGNGNGNGGNGNGGGNGGGNGNGGNGGGGNGGNGHGGRGGDLAFQIEPATWNTNWVNASGNVQAFLRGGDAGKVDLGSILLAGDGGKTLSPRSARYAGGQVVATFSKADAFDLLDNPKRGDTRTVTLQFSVNGAQKELTDSVRIVGDAGQGGSGGGGEEEGETRLSLDPDDWNTNWQRSAGTVHAFLRGGALGKVDLTTVRLVGDKAGAEPLKPTDVRRVGKQIATRFAKSAAYATLDDPHSGQHHMVKITFKADGADVELVADIRVVGP
jgi:hypothetical protein